MNLVKPKQSRFEMRLTPDEKVIWEKASMISGHSSLAGFVSDVVRREAKAIIEDHDKILASERDNKIFFEAILSDIEPNQKLKEAVKRYKKQ